MIHRLDSSKTGLAAPSLACLKTLEAEFGADRVIIVVDACQLRASTASLAAYRGFGWIILVTGSKFISGPAFSGAIILPAGATRLPPDLPGYDPIDKPSIGVLLRWRAALSEWRGFAEIPETRKRDIAVAFAATARRLLDARSGFAVWEAMPRDRAAGEESWDAQPTIFTFAPGAASGSRHFDIEALRWLFFRLLEPQAARPVIRLGQPVTLGDAGRAGLRISLDARMMCALARHELPAMPIIERRLDCALDHVERLARDWGGSAGR